jgi:hypothetical protein
MAAAILAALGLSGFRLLARRRSAASRERALASTPGMSPENPLRIGSFTEIDDAVDTLRCPCGGLLERIGEGGRPGMRVVRCACVICEEDVDLFFDLATLRH